MGGDELLDDFGIDDRPARGNCMQSLAQLGPVHEPFLEQVRAAVRAALEQCRRVARLGVDAEDHDADVRVGGAKLFCEPDSLVAVRRRHPDVGHDDVRHGPLARGAQLVEVSGRLNELDSVETAQHVGDALPNEKAVLADDYSDRHSDEWATTSGESSGASGTATWMVTPAPGSETTSSSPPTAPIRSRIVTRPIPSEPPPAWNPTPSSAMLRSIRSPSRSRSIVIRAGPACLAAFWIASSAQK